MSLLARLDAALLRRHQRACPWPTGSGAVETKGAKMARDERTGVASETEGEKGTELRPCDSEALTEPTGLAEAHRIAVRYWREAMDARASVRRLTRINEIIMSTSDDERAAASKALWDAARKVAALRQELADTRIRLAERDAQVTALTKRLSEGLG